MKNNSKQLVISESQNNGDLTPLELLFQQQKIAKKQHLLKLKEYRKQLVTAAMADRSIWFTRFHEINKGTYLKLDLFIPPEGKTKTAHRMAKLLLKAADTKLPNYKLAQILQATFIDNRPGKKWKKRDFNKSDYEKNKLVWDSKIQNVFRTINKKLVGFAEVTLRENYSEVKLFHPHMFQL